MNQVTRVKQLLSELTRDTASPLYAVCQQIVVYLEQNPSQNILTIGGLRVALRRAPESDELLIRAAFTLALHPFYALQVRYRLYDEKLKNVIQEMEHVEYMDASTRDDFVDVEGNEIALNELHRRTYPYFVNMFKAGIVQFAAPGGKD
ncbi:hypothetical protein [Citrobacter portucalensis]|uniref:hypothetical protein n=1 Tax=Citrobacter portucalensis TaxID=1639133 RepID=UPI002244431D|nr:hypothetical protein [Citrobacter portucalensis]MCW8354032.1 hypothetical protein [Citrobacter portucalensis]MCX9054108.1 hypothetical protein [Citrobacter portucalensis]